MGNIICDDEVIQVMNGPVAAMFEKYGPKGYNNVLLRGIPDTPETRYRMAVLMIRYPEIVQKDSYLTLMLLVQLLNKRADHIVLTKNGQRIDFWLYKDVKIPGIKNMSFRWPVSHDFLVASFI